MKKPQFLRKYLRLPNGDTLRSDLVMAVRLGDYVPEGKPHSDVYRSPEYKWRVIVDFGAKDRFGESHSNCLIQEFESKERRDSWARKLCAHLPNVVDIPREPL